MTTERMLREELNEMKGVDEVEATTKGLRIWCPAYLDQDDVNRYSAGHVVDEDGETTWNTLFHKIEEYDFKYNGMGLNEKRNQFYVRVEKR